MPRHPEHREQLPRYQPITAERIIVFAGAVAGILAIVITFFKVDDIKADQRSLIVIAELSLFCCLLVGYIYVISRRKLHRYAQAVLYLHYINHIIRDHQASRKFTKDDLHEIMQEIVDATAHCFSLLTGKRCRCCIKEIVDKDIVKTVVRDRISSSQTREAPSEVHKIGENTDFSSLFYGKNGYVRYFHCGNLLKLWRVHKYENSSFRHVGEPSIKSIFAFSMVRNWRLPYKSLIVWPIRYIPPGTEWPILNDEDMQQLPPEKRPVIMGFLTVDCRSKNVFDEYYSSELGAAIADALFTMMDVRRILDENVTKIGTMTAIEA